MPGNASLGNQQNQLPVGDYLSQITNVELGTQTDFKDRTKEKPAFIFSVDVQVDGEWQSRKIYTPRYFTDMSRPGLKAQFVSGLNKLVRACGLPVPQTAQAVDAWDEEDLVGKQFIWRVFEDEETGEVARKFLPRAPQDAAATEPVTRPPVQPPRGRPSTRQPAAPPATAVAEEDEDIFANA